MGNHQASVAGGFSGTTNQVRVRHVEQLGLMELEDLIQEQRYAADAAEAACSEACARAAELHAQLLRTEEAMRRLRTRKHVERLHRRHGC